MNQDPKASEPLEALVREHMRLVDLFGEDCAQNLQAASMLDSFAAVESSARSLAGGAGKAAPETWEPPTAWEIIRAAEEAGMQGLTEPYLSEGDRRISGAGKAFIKAAHNVNVLYNRQAQRYDKQGGSAPAEPPLAYPDGYYRALRSG